MVGFTRRVGRRIIGQNGHRPVPVRHPEGDAMRRALTLTTLLGLGLALSACGTDEGGSGGSDSPTSSVGTPSGSAPDDSPAPSADPSGSTSPSDPSGGDPSGGDDLLEPGEKAEKKHAGRNGSPVAYLVKEGSTQAELAVRCDGGGSMTLAPTRGGQGTPVGPEVEVACDGERHDLTLTAEKPFSSFRALTPTMGHYEIAVLSTMQ